MQMFCWLIFPPEEPAIINRRAHRLGAIHATYATHSIIIIYTLAQEKKKRTEEKKQRKLENQKKAELVQKVGTVI